MISLLGMGVSDPIKSGFSIIDCHAHLDFPQFDGDRQDVIQRALDAGVSIINVGIDLSSSRRAIDLAEAYPEVAAAVGIHPNNTGETSRSDVTAGLAELARHDRVVAIGEVGLDFYRDHSPPPKQLAAFKWQLELAEELDLPVIIHCRQAERELIPMLLDWASTRAQGNPRPPGVIHCFSGNITTAREYLEAGFLISFGAYIGYPSSREMVEVIRYIPQDRLLAETDCPFLPPQNRRGKRNEPSFLPFTVALLAEIRGVTAPTIAAATTANALRLFPRLTQPGRPE